MAIDTVIAYVGVYDSVDQAEADYQLVKDLHIRRGRRRAARRNGCRRRDPRRGRRPCGGGHEP
jgi:hypothetical protein